MKHTPRRNKLFMITGLLAAGIVAAAAATSTPSTSPDTAA